jgi:hypothetical protein
MKPKRAESGLPKTFRNFVEVVNPPIKPRSYPKTRKPMELVKVTA